MAKKINVKDMLYKGKQFWKEPPKGKYLNLKEILCLGSTTLGISFIYNIISLYVTVGTVPLLYNMGDYGTLHATLMCLAASILGLILTPVYGKFVQRTNTKFGRYKPYLLFLAPLVSILGALSVWSPQNLNTTQTTIYVYMVCTPTLLVSGIWYNTWQMFPGVITPNEQERTDIWAPLGLVYGFAPTIMNVLKDLFAGIWGDRIAARIFSITSAVVGTLMVVALIKVKERVFVTKTENTENKIGVLEGLKLVFKNKPLVILSIALILGGMRSTIDPVWYIMARVKYASNMADAAKIFGAVSLFVGFAATPNMILLPLFTRKMNKRNIMIMWLAINMSANLIFGIVGIQNIPTGTTAAIVISILRFVSWFNAIGTLLPLMVSETADYQQYISKYRLDGFIQTLAYSVPGIIGQALMLIPAVIQGKIGFNPNNYIITEGANGLNANQMAENVLSQDKIDIATHYGNIAVWISFASGVLMIIALCFYTLDKKKHAEIVEQLKLQSVNTDEIEEDKGNLTILDDESKTESADPVESADNAEIENAENVTDTDEADGTNSEGGEENTDI